MKTTLNFYLMCFISTYLLSSNIQDLGFKSFYLVGCNPLVTEAGMPTNTKCSARLEVGRKMHSVNSHLSAGAVTTELTGWFRGPFFLSLRVSLDLRIG